MTDLDWRDLIDAALTRTDSRGARRSAAINYPTELYAFVLEAARGRDMSMASYQRRASLAVAQHDLGFDWFTAMAVEPLVSTFTAGKTSLPPGTGFGPWWIPEMREFPRG